MTAKISKKQRGFTIVELLIVLAIIGLLVVFGIPFMRGIIVQGKTEPTASDISKVVTKIRGNFAGNGGTPYGGVTTAVMANAGRGLFSNMTVAGAGGAATLTHDLGATGAAVTALPATLTVLNDSFAITVNNVNEAACPGLAAQINRVAEVITINGVAGNAKAFNGAYNPAAAQNACTARDTNTFVFTFR